MGVDTSSPLRDWLWQRLREPYNDQVVLNGHPLMRLPNTLNASFIGYDGREILAAMGVQRGVGVGAVRLSMGVLEKRQWRRR